VARKKIIWSTVAEAELMKILEFFNERNQSKAYSKKLVQQFRSVLKQVANQPKIGLLTQAKNIRGIVSGNYILFYHVGPKKITVLKVWDTRQNPDRVKFRLI
jgi:plasmid stabilization system protein ParE